MRYVVDLRHPLQAPCVLRTLTDLLLLQLFSKIDPAVEAVEMWESRRDFQEEWEGWKAGSMAFRAFHSSPFPPRSSLQGQRSQGIAAAKRLSRCQPPKSVAGGFNACIAMNSSN
jgi:hypothetical protein